ncbi:MAG: hypothetical protein ACLFN5_00165 [bacterium]
MYYYFIMTPVVLLGIGLLGLIICQNLIIKLINIIVVFNALNLFLVSANYFMDGELGKIFVFLLFSYLTVISAASLGVFVFIAKSSGDNRFLRR